MRDSQASERWVVLLHAAGTRGRGGGGAPGLGYVCAYIMIRFLVPVRVLK